jgi:hypothetical protein
MYSRNRGELGAFANRTLGKMRSPSKESAKDSYPGCALILK